MYTSSSMTLLQAYLANPRTQRALARRSGEKGFSLIELVVVVAILAILAAVALPNFLSVSKDAQIAAAKNTLATVVKECTAQDVKGNGTELKTVQAAQASLNGYKIYDGDGTAVTTTSTVNCYAVSAKNHAEIGSAKLPDFKISFNPTTGQTSKQCTLGGATGAYNPGIGSCDESKNGDPVTSIDKVTGTKTTTAAVAGTAW